MSVKVIAGYYRGRNLETPVVTKEESPVRPTKARVREAAFNMIFSRMDFADAVCFDLFCGSGAAGIEALSRGAEHVTFVDTDTTWAQKNIQACKIPSEQFSILRQDVLNFNPTQKADLILLDPPYGQNLCEAVLKNAEKLGKPETLWLLEVETKHDLAFNQAQFTLLKQKKYGKSTLYLLEQLC